MYGERENWISNLLIVLKNIRILLLDLIFWRDLQGKLLILT